MTAHDPLELPMFDCGDPPVFDIGELPAIDLSELAVDLSDIPVVGLDSGWPVSAADSGALTRKPCQSGNAAESEASADKVLRPGLAFGDALKHARIEAGIPTQACLARATGLPAGTLCRFERGVRLPTLLQFAALTLKAGLDPTPLLAALDEEPR